MRILIAPDKFKGAVSARQAAEALAAGVRAAWPDAHIELQPLADGGEGSGQLLASALQALPQRMRVHDPLHRPVDATWWFDVATGTAVIELAEAAGLWRLAGGEQDPLVTTTYGVGELLLEALRSGAHEIYLAVGGSATVDGGAGMLQALGWELYDHRGDPLDPPCAGGQLESVFALELVKAKAQPPMTVLCDVDNPLLGDRGAAPVYAPQKGADPAAVTRLDRGLKQWARVLGRYASLPDLATRRFGGAAGGVPSALAAAWRAELVAGFQEIARCVALDEKIAAADVVLTGEGRLDPQTSGGKVVSGLAQRCRRHNVDAFAFVGHARGRGGAESDHRALANELALTGIIEISPPELDLSAALKHTATNLEGAAKAWARNYR